MPARWVVNPVVTVDVPDWGVTRVPKVSQMDDPGRPGKTYQHTSIISDGVGRPGERDDVCLSLVFGADLSALDAARGVVHVLEDDFATHAALRLALEQTPRQRGWGLLKLGRVKTRLEELGAATDDLTLDAVPVAEILERLSRRIHTRHGGVRGLRTTERV